MPTFLEKLLFQSTKEPRNGFYEDLKVRSSLGQWGKGHAVDLHWYMPEAAGNVGAFDMLLTRLSLLRLASAVLGVTGMASIIFDCNQGKVSNQKQIFSHRFPELLSLHFSVFQHSL